MKDVEAQSDIKQLEFNFCFNLYEATFAVPDLPEFIRASCYNICAARKAHQKSTIKVSDDITKRALRLVDQIPKIDFFEFLKTFSLNTHFERGLLVQKIEEFLSEGNDGAAARAIIYTNLFDSFDIPPLVKKLVEKSRKNY